MPNQVGEQAGSTSSGAGYSRVLTSGLVGLRQVDGYPVAKALPDGSWTLFQHTTSSKQVWMAKMTPFQLNDAVDRSGFLPLRVDLIPPANQGIQTATIEFGYAEHGSPDQFYCPSRRESCAAVTSSLTQADPFKYAVSDQYVRTPCSTGCSITTPALPMHVVYYRSKYFDGSGAVVSVGPMRVGSEMTGVK